MNKTFEDLYQWLGQLPVGVRQSHLAVELVLTEEVLSSCGSADGRHPDVSFDQAGLNHQILDEGHPLIIVQW